MTGTEINSNVLVHVSQTGSKFNKILLVNDNSVVSILTLKVVYRKQTYYNDYEYRHTTRQLSKAKSLT